MLNQNHYWNKISTRHFWGIKAVTTFFTNFRVSEIICSLKLVLKAKVCKEITESSRFKFLENALQFCLARCRNNISGPLKRWGIVDLPLLITLLATSQKFTISSFNNPSANVNSLPELCFRQKLIVLLVQMKEVISINCGSSKSS